VITFTANRTITFVYDASGAKLQKITNNNGVKTTYDYVNGVEYENTVLKRIAHTEGSISVATVGTSLVGTHEYVLRDHLGNTRVTFSDVGNDGVISNRTSTGNAAFTVGSLINTGVNIIDKLTNDQK
jgi:hypothetical protein